MRWTGFREADGEQDGFLQGLQKLEMLQSYIACSYMLRTFIYHIIYV
jgi:hypothetical protein